MKQRRGGTSEKEEENECVKERERERDRRIERMARSSGGRRGRITMRGYKRRRISV